MVWLSERKKRIRSRVLFCYINSYRKAMNCTKWHGRRKPVTDLRCFCSAELILKLLLHYLSAVCLLFYQSRAAFALSSSVRHRYSAAQPACFHCIAGSTRETQPANKRFKHQHVSVLSCLVKCIFYDSDLLRFIVEARDGHCSILQILTQPEESTKEDGIADLCDI